MPQDPLKVEVFCAVDSRGADPAELTVFITAEDDGWRATGRFELSAGQLICRRLDIGGAQLSAPGITSGFLRRIPMGAILTAVRGELARQADQFEKAGARAGTATDFGKSAKAMARSLRPGDLTRGRRGYPDAHYRRIAFAYLALQEKGWGRGLLDELARQEDRPRETVRDWVRGARKRRFLTPASPGRAGALPGPELPVRPSR